MHMSKNRWEAETQKANTDGCAESLETSACTIRDEDVKHCPLASEWEEAILPISENKWEERSGAGAQIRRDIQKHSQGILGDIQQPAVARTFAVRVRR
jgi:hypothetical protein